MERLTIKYRITICLSILLLSFPLLAQKTARLRLEPIYYLSYGFSRFNPATEATTPPEFYKVSPFGNAKNINGETASIASKPLNRYYAAGFIIHYGIKPNIDLDISAQTSGVGSEGFSFAGGSGDAVRVSRFALSPTFKIIYWRKHNLSIHAGLGVMLDAVSKTTPQFSGGTIFGQIDTITYGFNATILNNTGFSLHPNIQLKFRLENGNSFNFHITGAIGLIPLNSSNYSYSRNQESYYTELISNGSFFRIGIGYEFQFLRHLVTYPGNGTKYEHHDK